MMCQRFWVRLHQYQIIFIKEKEVGPSSSGCRRAAPGSREGSGGDGWVEGEGEEAVRKKVRQDLDSIRLYRPPIMCNLAPAFLPSFLQCSWTVSFVSGAAQHSRDEDLLSWCLESTGWDRTKASRPLGGKGRGRFLQRRGRLRRKRQRLKFFRISGNTAWVDLPCTSASQGSTVHGFSAKEKELADSLKSQSWLFLYPDRS